MYPLGFRDANQLPGGPKEAVQNSLAGLTKILARLMKGFPDSWVWLVVRDVKEFSFRLIK